ncbi:hypothetical protein ACTOJ1_000690 [Shigella flexneri]
MSYRLDEVIDFLFDEDRLNPDFEDELYRLFLDENEWVDYKLELPEFEFLGKVYPAKTFVFSREFEKEMDDYCEGKCTYYYGILLKDKLNNDCYDVTVNMYNGDPQWIEVEYKGKFKKPDCCENKCIVSVNAKCDDTFSYKEGDKEWKEASPSLLKLGNEDYIEFKYCKNCGKIHFE